MSTPAIRPGDPLSARELEVLRLTANGRSNDQVARDLHLTYHTVKSHMVRIYTKLGAHDRAHAVALAIRSRQLHPREIAPTDAVRSMT